MQAFFKIAGSEQAGLSPDGMGVNGMAGTVTRKESENMAARQNISNQCQSGIRFMIFGLTTFVTYVTFRNMTGKELMKELQKSGWKLDRTHGSHYIMKEGWLQANINTCTCRKRHSTRDA